MYPPEGVRLLEAHLSIDAPRDWTEDIVRRHDAKVTIQGSSRHEDWCKVFVEVHVRPGGEQALLSDLEAMPSVRSEDLVVTGPGVLKGALSSDDCLGCCSAEHARGFPMEGTLHEDGSLVQVVIAPDRDSVRAMVSSMERHGHAVTLLRLSTLEPEELLTSRQEDLLLTALERGFFDYPKGTSMRDLAKSFGVSISTISEMLRKATYKVMDAYFDATP